MAMTAMQVRNHVYAAVSRAVNNGQRIEDTVDEVLAVVGREVVDFDAAGDALLELVADAVVFGLGAWAEGVAGSIDGHGDDIDPTAIARNFLESYRALLVLWSELPLDVKVSDAFQSALLDAKAGGHHYGYGYVRIDAFGRLQRLDPGTVRVKG